MCPDDVPQVMQKLNADLAKHKVYIQFSEEEVAHFLLPQDKVIYSYVVEAEDGSGEITDFFSFYCLPSSILKHTEHKTLHVAYSYYNFTTTDRMEQGMKDMLVLAKEEGFDVFNCLDLLENAAFFENLKFMPGDGNLQYYLYNWRIKGITPADVGMVLV